MKMPNGARGIDVKLDALLFDFDGVILESADIKTDAFRELFADQPAHVEEIVALHQRYGGVSRHVTLESACPVIVLVRGVEETLEALVAPQATVS